MTSFTQTRQALPTQIEEALADLVARGRVNAWNRGTPDSPLSYVIDMHADAFFVGTPGQTMDWLNATRNLYDRRPIEFGRRP